MDSKNITDTSDTPEYILKEEIELKELIVNNTNKEFTVLDLTNKLRGSRIIEYLNKCHSLENLTDLNLTNNQLGNQGMYYFKNCFFLKYLGRLNLSDNNIMSEGLGYLSKCDYLKDLKFFDFANNPIEKNFESLGNLSNCSFFSSLQGLNLSGNKIGDDGLIYLFTKQSTQNLIKVIEHLDIFTKSKFCIK